MTIKVVSIHWKSTISIWRVAQEGLFLEEIGTHSFRKGVNVSIKFARWAECNHDLAACWVVQCKVGIFSKAQVEINLQVEPQLDWM
jgi:hypothetical protein